MHIPTKDERETSHPGLIKYFIHIYGLVVFSFFVAIGFSYFITMQALNNPAIVQLLFSSYVLWVILLTLLSLIIIMTIFLRHLSVFLLMFMLFILALSIGILSSFYSLINLPNLRQILYIPLGIFIFSSIFAQLTKYDFRGMKPFIIIGIFGVIIASFGYSILGVMGFEVAAPFQLIMLLVQYFLLACFVIWKTQSLKNLYPFYREQGLEKKAVIMGALDLFIVVISLFLYLPRLLGGKRQAKLKI